MGDDVVTGDVLVDDGYVTSGPQRSSYVNGISRVTTEVLPLNAMYNTNVNWPYLLYNITSVDDGKSGRLIRG